jgi:tetratricopeptide (TPR) repeat protein
MKTQFISLFFLSFFFTATSFAQNTAFEDAMRLCRAGNHAEAVKAFDEAHKADPNNADALFGMAKCHLQLGHEVRAIHSYEKGVALDNSKFMPFVKLADLYGKHHKEEEAVLMYQRAFQLAQRKIDKGRCKVRLLKLLMDKEDYSPENLKHLQEFEALGLPYTGDAARYATALYLLNGKGEKAEEAALSAIEHLSEEQKESAEQLYITYLKAAHANAHYSQMADYIDGVITEEGKAAISTISHEHYYNLGYAYFFALELEKSRMYLERALEIKPDYTSARIFLNQVGAKEADKTYAIEHLRFLIAKEETPRRKADHFRELSRLYLHQKKYPDAIRAADSSLYIVEGNHKALFIKALAAYKTNDNDDAITLLEEVTKHTNHLNEETRSRYFFSLGLAYLRLEDARAEKAFNHARYGTYQDAVDLELEELKEKTQ